MKVFRDLFIYVNRDNTSKFIARLEEKLSDGWIRDTDAEKKTVKLINDDFFYFTCTAKDERNAVLLALMRRDEQTLYVSNIVPQEPLRLSYGQYNFILEEFYEHFVKPVVEEMGLKASLSSDEENIENWISEESVKKLKKFSVAANKSTGSAHPSDLKRWFDFIITVHHEHNNLDVSRLSGWLIEREHWPEDIVHELAMEYEFAMGLLDFSVGKLNKINTKRKEETTHVFGFL